MRDLRMFGFHVRQFARNSYFVQLLLTSTLGVLILQELAARASGTDDDSTTWVRSGMVGMWTVGTVSAGMIGYQRYQGTLAYLVRTPLATPRTLLPVVGAASVFGMAAFPVAALGASALRENLASGQPLLLTGAILMFWLACFAVSSVVGMTFVLTPNAITYEGLLVVPLVLLSGVFGTPEHTPTILLSAAQALPTRVAAETLLAAVGAGQAPTPGSVALGLAVSIAWLVLAAFLATRVTRRAVTSGTLEVV
jgi:ABC-2 type transport system permease protein